ncbi:MAG TPA: DUF2330 domain-containing protein [Bacteroidetes bacterium]|nr:DUF2330 domain-containing protein [Bacteroidota bacterium]
MKYINLIFIFVLLMPITALADGGFFYPMAGVGHSADQKAILVYDPDFAKETMILHTEQDWTDSKHKEDFAWVVPEPSLMSQGDFTTLANAEGAFEELYYLTEPRGNIFYEPPVCGGCMRDNAGDEALSGEVTVVESFQVENYDIQILTSEDSSDMQNWLEENGYSYSEESIPVLDYYIQKDWYFTAVKINMSPDSASTTISSSTALNPLQMTFSTDNLIFPLHISSASSDPSEKTEILLYIFAPYRVASTNYNTMEMEIRDKTFSSDEDFQDYYNNKFNSLLNGSDGRGFIVEYASPLSYPPYALEPILEPDKEYYLTRLRTEISPIKMDEDVEFAQAETNEPFIIGMKTPKPDRFIYLASILGIFSVFRIFSNSHLLKKSLVIGSIVMIIISLIIF